MFEEIVFTERTYVKDLEIMISNFFRPLLAESTRSGGSFVTHAQVKTIFQSIEMVCAYNNVLLEDLEAALTAYHPNYLIGPIFTKFAPFLKTYNSYVSGYSDAVQTIQELSKTSPEFTAWLDRAFIATKSNKVDLPSFLITPIQRIPRYQLLLNDMLKHTWDFHPDYANLKSALEIVTETATAVDRMKEAFENTQKCVAVQAQLGKNVENLVSASRRFVREGLVGELNPTSKKLSQRWYFVFNDIIIRCKPPSTTLRRKGGGNAPMFDYIDRLPMKGAVVAARGSDAQQADESGFSFMLHVAHVETLVVLPTAEERDAWLGDIQKLIESVEQAEEFYDREKTRVAANRAQGMQGAILSYYQNLSANMQCDGDAVAAASSVPGAAPAAAGSPAPAAEPEVRMRRFVGAKSTAAAVSSPIPATGSPAASPGGPAPQMRKWAMSIQRGQGGLRGSVGGSASPAPVRSTEDATSQSARTSSTDLTTSSVDVDDDGFLRESGGSAESAGKKSKKKSRRRGDVEESVSSSSTVASVSSTDPLADAPNCEEGGSAAAVDAAAPREHKSRKQSSRSSLHRKEKKDKE